MSAFEAHTVELTWKVDNLRELLASSKGSEKSKVTKGPLFGNGEWQILFYANSGTSDGAFMSLYLSCEPTNEELEKALNGRWKRDGKYKFILELWSADKNHQYTKKEATGHSFQAERQNWGWVSFTRRDSLRDHDSLVIVCTIISFSKPVQTPRETRIAVPKSLVDTFGSLLNDLAHSDVKFILPDRRRKGQTRCIYANRKILERVDYFRTMFRSGFAEGQSVPMLPVDEDMDASSYESFDDSDEDDDFEGEINVNWPAADESFIAVQDESIHAAKSLNVDRFNDEKTLSVRQNSNGSVASLSGVLDSAIVQPRQYSTVAIKDAAYSTYLAVLYYIYTETITFAPLSSSFTSPSVPTSPSVATLTSPSEPQANLRPSQILDDAILQEPSSRREWLAQWKLYNSDLQRPPPCSAKAVYRLADKLNLTDLKERAFQHIKDNLTVENIAFEVFSSFAATYAEVRQVQVDFFLTRWAEIRTSPSMQVAWSQIRHGRHPGFEQVFPVIAQHLVFQPPDNFDSK